MNELVFEQKKIFYFQQFIKFVVRAKKYFVESTIFDLIRSTCRKFNFVSKYQFEETKLFCQKNVSFSLQSTPRIIFILELILEE